LSHCQPQVLSNVNVVCFWNLVPKLTESKAWPTRGFAFTERGYWRHAKVFEYTLFPRTSVEPNTHQVPFHNLKTSRSQDTPGVKGLR
jgi:hypothetical protein